MERERTRGRFNLYEIGTCTTPYGYILIGSDTRDWMSDIYHIIAEFQRTDGIHKPFTSSQIGEIMELGLSYENYCFYDNFISEVNFHTPYFLFPLMQLQAKLQQRQYGVKTEDN